ncbi:non-ribosomal peptide synthetase [Hyalangium minutum]|uniref:Long-chain-fatty-acid--CoA ligase n=1 Tax=Hyalangium minutum TaxID=394096 RepID=A0A085WP71_9BACT|nr:non-ribosomal peptide synthetase [Hyalangium minutum]APZ78692.1 nonribosomal peptide synthetase [Hyalangium minutum]KFE69484.1 Long-chain-fatty-acid--CoA ligase [Hyalangium minutum]
MTEAELIEDIYELAPMQHGLLFHSLLEPSAGMYVEQLSCELRGRLSLDQWKAAWQHVLARHAILRSSFLWEGLEKPVQVVAKEAELPWHLEDLRGATREEQERRIESFLNEDRLRGFELASPPLLRCALLRLGEEHYRFVWTYHHLLLDGWCFAIVLREVLESFAGGLESLPPPARPYRDYITWLQEQDPTRAESFWRELLRGFEQPTPLPFMERRQASKSAHGAQPEVVKHLPRELTARLATFAKEHRLTLNTLVQGAWGLLLGRTTGTDDVIFGVTVSGRPSELAGSESIVGLFINTVPLRARLDGSATIPAFLSALQAQQSSFEPHVYVSLADIQLWSDAPHDRPLFESLLVFENYPIDRSTLLERSGLEISSIHAQERINYPLAVVAIPGESLELRVMYQEDTFSRAAAERLARLLETALGALLTAKTVGEIDFLDEPARRVLAEWGQNPRVFDHRAPVHELVALVARSTPGALAVVGADGQKLTYLELNERAERVARRLRLLGAGRERIVGVCIGSSVERVVGLLGVLKAGAAYMPLDPNYPSERLAYLVGDASPTAILNAGADPVPDTRIPRLDVARVSLEAAASDAPARDASHLEDLAYVIYTSGSTGAPKGVLASHQNLLNLVSWHTEAFGLTAKDRTTHLASIAFDAAVWEIWPTLAAGATLHLVPPELPAAPDELSRWLVERQITISFLPTAVAEAALALPWPADCSLRFMLTGGDRLHLVPPPGLPFRLVNNYGPTETTVVATSGIVEAESRNGLPSIGRPIANARIYILDRMRRPVLPGVIGELYIGGAGVTRGYLNRPELSASRFFPDPFSDAPAARMYASGDLAQFRADGTLAFHGRVDRQVQVRGVRVEPGEIEAVLAEYPGVSAAAVVGVDSQGNGDIRLVGFAACASQNPPGADALASYLGEKLPEVMVPRQIIILSELPLTPNGKVDSAALEARAREEQVHTEHIAPRTPHEEILAGIWSAVLGQDRIGVEEDFFALGGHSLKATQVIARAREAFGIDLPVRAIFERRTIALLAEAVAGHGASSEPIPRLEQSGDGPLSPGQESLWFIDALGGNTEAYNVPLVIRLTGTLDTAAVARALALLVERHEVLRTTFHERAGVPVQRIGPSPASVLSSEDVTPELLERRISEEITTPFSLTTGPLFRARLFRQAPDTHTLVINQHHIIVDAWSVSVLLREFCIAYAAFASGERPELPELPNRYTDWVAWQNQRLVAGRLEEGLAYWRQTLKGAPQVLTLPGDRPRPTRQSFRGKTLSFALEGSIGRRLEALSRGSGASLFMTLLSAFAAYLGRLSGQDEIVIGSPTANRDRRETEGMVGYFLNTIALRIDLSEDPPFTELLQRVRKAALDGYSYQDIPFEKVVAALELPRALSHNPLFQVMFSLQGQSGGEIQLPGVRATLPTTESPTSKFDLTLFVEPREDSFACLLEYNTDIFDEDRIRRMATHLVRVLEAVAEEPELRVSEVPLLAPEERQLIAQLAQPGRLDDSRTLLELFERQVEKTPEAAALEHRGDVRTYRQLSQEAEALAVRLAALGAGPDVRVAICLERSITALVSVLAVLKAGATYVPLEPSEPPERLQAILGDAKARVLIAEKKYRDLNLPPGVEFLWMDGGGAPAVKAPRPRTASHHLACVLYASGSGGEPKGVAMPHRALLNLTAWHTAQPRPLRTLQYGLLNTGASLQEIFSTWCSGGTLVLAGDANRLAPRALVQLLEEARIQRLFLPAGALHPLAREAVNTHRPLPDLEEIIAAGEQLRITDPIRQWFVASKKRLRCQYSVAEAYVVAAHELTGSPESWPGLPPIGRPIPNTAIYLLDTDQRSVPVGVPGEIYVSGACLADGYLLRPELTAERFLELSVDPPVRAFQTGDLGRLRRDGTVEFLGRADGQILVRGIRVEPGEVERALCAHPSILDAVAVAAGDPTRAQRLVAYVTPETVRIDELPAFLSERVPEYMVPSQFVALPELPRTPGGKLDRRALPAPGRGEAATGPRTPMEELVAQAFEQVLWRSPVGLHEDFFQIGGNPRLALQAVERISAAVNAEVRLSDLLKNPAVASLSRVISERQGRRAPSPAGLELAPESARAALSFAQERLWFLEQLYPGTAVHHLSMALRLKGALDTGALIESLAGIIQRHPVLGMRFIERDGRVWQEPRAQGEVPFELAVPGPVSATELRRLLVEEAARPFDLANGPLFRARLFRIEDSEHVLVTTMHHAVGDPASLRVLLRELSQFYTAHALGRPAQLPALASDFLSHAREQRRSLQGEALEERLGYWKKNLSGAPGTLSLPADRVRPPQPGFRGATQRLALSRAVSKGLETLSERLEVAGLEVLLSGFAAYLARITGQEDIVIGLPVVHRERGELQPLIGRFEGALPIRIDLSSNPTFEELITRVHRAALGAYAHQDVPLEKIVEAVDAERDLSQTPLFQVLLWLQEEAEGRVALPGLTLEPFSLELGTAKFDLALLFEPVAGELTGVIEYSTDLFDPDRIERMAGHILTVFEDAVAYPGKRLSELLLLPEEERRTVSALARGRVLPPAREVPVHKLVEEHARRAPDSIALELGGAVLTYGELNERANRAAHQLIALGAGPEKLVALAAPRSFELIIGLLAIWKAGAAYVPLDLSYPKARLDTIFEDSGAGLIVSTHAAESRWRVPHVRTLWIDEPSSSELSGNPDSGVRMENAAYVIYTSGSTGQPKGVILEHRGLANVIEMQRHELGADSSIVMLQFSSISFDVSVWEIVMALTNGGRLVLAPADTLLAGEELAKVLITHRVTHMVLPPTSYAVLPADREYPSLRLLLAAGEALPPEVVNTWARPGVQFVNAYGPTEVTIICTLGACKQGESGPPPIGRPALNLEGYVLDSHGALVPIGVPGELHLGGVGVARGYLNREELTRQKFIPHPFKPGERLYRSGDLVRWRKDGNLEYLGRIDHQVKLRGYRIELGEIESVLATHPGVAKAVTIVYSAGASGGVKLLVAYVVPAGPVDAHAIREHARKRLPEFMVPSEIVLLEDLPLTSSGKVDRKRLPAPRLEEHAARAAFVAPRTPTEQTLAALWEELLEKRPIGTGDNFFQLGGHSLLAAQVMSRVRRTLGVEVPLSAIFEQPTLAALASVIAAKEAAPQLPPLVRLKGEGDRPLSFAQERLRFLAELEGDSAAYNIPIALRLRGQLDEGALSRSLRQVVERHEPLRTRFPLVEGQPVARLVEGDIPLVTEDLRGSGAPPLDRRLREESTRPFSLEHGPVVRAHLFKAAEQEHVLLVVMHHIVSDGWSFGVMMRELSAIYAAQVRGETLTLPELPIQYADYAAWQRSWLDGHVRDQQLAYWRSALAGAPAVLELPADRPRPTVRSHRGAVELLALDRDVTQVLTALCRQEGVTSYMALLAAFGAWLGRVSGQEDVVIGSPFAGRRIAETEPLIGFFVNTLPLRVDLSGDPSFLELLQRVRRQVLAAHENQDVPFEKLVEKLNPERVLGTSPIFQVMLAFQQAQPDGMELPGLEVKPVSMLTGTAKFDLTLSVEETARGVQGWLEYDVDLFDAWRVQAMVRQLTGFIASLAAAPKARLSEADLLSAEERAKLVPSAPEEMPRLPAVHEAIAAQARKTPAAIAVEAEDGTLSYEELEARAGAVAHELVRRGVTPGALVAIAVERSLGMMVGLLGILKAGGAYVPLDPAYPRERLAFMLEDSGARVVITQEHLAPMFPDAEVLVLDAARQGSFEPRSGALAYCLFTSGSTGQPKGVLIEHSSLANHMEWMNEALPLGPEDRVLQRTSLSFDASVWELFAPLMVGARLVLAPHGLGADTEHLVRVLRERGITVLQLVPSLLTALVEEPGLAGVSTLRRVCVGGEPLPSATVKKLFSVCNVEIWNLYGPTEATIDALAHRCRPEEVGAHGATEPIGLPIRRMKALILDGRLRPVPDGLPGELYLSGPGLARGYLNRPELTESRFIEHAFPGGPRLRMYKTGDIVRRQADGTLLFTGRADRQVKLRGYRIELGEIEGALGRHPAVREAVALVRGTSGDARLVAFVVPRAGAKQPEASELRGFVERQLAAHMVPGQFVLLEELPHAPNGKVDVRALGAMELAEERGTSRGGIPRDAMELELVRLFEEILGVRSVGIHDSFFELGGHSLLALKLKLAVEKRLQRPLPLVSLFRNPAPAQLAELLRSGTSAASPLVPLTPSARALLASEPAGSGARRAPALFLVPGGGSTPFYLVSLARHLEGTAVFGLQPRGLDGEAPPFEKLEDMAAWYADAILSVQPEGPYFVGGHSMGGQIAYEIAQELKARGHEIGVVALLDTLAPFPEATRPLGEGWDTAQWLVHLAGVMESFFNVKLGLELSEVRAMSDAERLESFVVRLQSAAVLPAGAQPSHVMGILNVTRALDAMNSQPRRRQPVPLAVFRAEDRDGPTPPELEALFADDTLGWNRFMPGSSTAYRVPGSHLTLIREPHVGGLARDLLGRLTGLTSKP